MAAGITDLLTQATVNSRPVPTQVSSTRSSGASTLQCLSLTGWPTGTAVHGVTYKTNTSGAKIAGSQIDFKAVVSGTQFTNFTIKAGTDNGHAIGDIVEAAPTAAYANDLYSWGSAHANQDGSLITAAVQTALGLGASSLNGWNALGFTFSSVTANGNHSYTCVVSSQDVTGTLSAGMRIRTTRTVAAPTQCTNLNGTNQYWSKTSPAGMTFTNNPVVSAWVKLSSYPGSAGDIASRYNGTSGWQLYVNSSGQINLVGRNAASGNFSIVTSYQSIPLNKWVHVAAQLDMATFTATPTTSYVMIDGVDVPASVARAGTNPTALIQAGNLEIGSTNGGTEPFPGKIVQVAIYSAKVTQATILASISQGLAGTETSLISAYSFNGNANDLNANANNLTSNNAAAATNADSPFGGQASGAISSTLDYAEVMDATFSTNTTLTVRVPDGNTIPTSGGVSAVVYSSNKSPYGWPGISNVLYRALLMTTFTATSGTLQDVLGLTSPALTIPTSGRRLRIKAFLAQSYSSVDSDRMDWSIDEDGTTIATVFNRMWTVGGGGSGGLIVETPKTATSGSHTYKLRVARGLGTGVANVFSSAAAPSYFEVTLEDEF